jgi:RNA polymerase sigma-70 factor (ECF subfamily)
MSVEDACRTGAALAVDETRQLEAHRVAAIYLEHGDRLRSFLLGVLRDPELAGEALQATFVKTMEHGHTARDETLKGWLFGVAFREAMLIRRRQSVDRRAVDRVAQQSPATSELPESSLVQAETVASVHRALDALPLDQRQVVRMRIYEEKTFATIADELNLPLGTVLSRMRLAVDKLRRELKPS